jgi:hypothetical protein
LAKRNLQTSIKLGYNIGCGYFLALREISRSRIDSDVDIGLEVIEDPKLGGLDISPDMNADLGDVERAEMVPEPFNN